MKSILKTGLILLTVVSLTACSALQARSAVNYNNSIVGMQNNIVKSMLAFSGAMGGDKIDAELLKTKNDELIKTIDENIASLEKLEQFPDDQGLKASAMDLFKFYKDIATKEYKEMIDILAKEELGSEDVTKIQELADQISEREEKFDEKFAKAQTDFAKKFGFGLEENKLQNQIDDL